MRKLVLTFALVMGLSFASKAQFMFRSQNGKVCLAVFKWNNGANFKAYLATENGEPSMFVSDGGQNLLGKTLVLFKTPLGEKMYIEFKKDFLSIEVFDKDFKPVATLFNDNKSYKANIEIK